MSVRSGDIQVGLLGDLPPAEIGGYYFTEFGIGHSNPRKDCSILTPLVVLLTKPEMINARVESSSSIDLILKVLPTFLSPNPIRLYIIPYKQGESFTEANLRVLSTNANTKKFGVAKQVDGHFVSVEWFQQSIIPFPDKFITVNNTISSEEWKTTLEYSRFMSFAVEHCALPPSQPRTLKYRALFSNVPEAPTKLPYSKRGVISSIETTKFEAKVSRYRGVEFIYYTNFLVPAFLFDFVHGKLPASKINLDVSVRRFIDIHSDLSRVLASHDDPKPAKLESFITNSHEKIAFGKVPGMPGLVVFAANPIKKGETVCPYNGEYRDYLPPTDKSLHYAFSVVHDGESLFSNNQAIHGFRRSNFASFINYAPKHSSDPNQAVANCGLLGFSYKNLLLIGYYALRDIEPNEQLLMDYSEDPRLLEACCFSFTKQNTILPNDSAKKEATRVTDEAFALFAGKNYQEAKRVLKRALVLQQLFQQNETASKVSYCLGWAYFHLMNASKGDPVKSNHYSEKSQQILKETCQTELNFSKKLLFSDPANAVTHLKISLEIVKLFPDDKKTFIAVCKALGAAYLSLSNNPSENTEKQQRKSYRFFCEAKALEGELFMSNSNRMGQ